MDKKKASSNYSEDELIDRSVFDHIKKEVHQKNTVKNTSSGTSKVFFVFLIGLVLFGGLLLSGALTGTGPLGEDFDSGDNIANPSNSGNNGNSGNDITSMCITHSNIQNHYHYEITIMINNVKQTIPGNIGISNDCMRPVHTHGSSGLIHVELPQGYSGSYPDLGDFFSIWQQPFGESKILDYEGDVLLTVNGNEIADGYRNYIPQNGDEISISA